MLAAILNDQNGQSGTLFNSLQEGQVMKKHHEYECKNCLTSPTDKQLKEFKLQDKPLLCKNCGSDDFQQTPLPEDSN